MIRVLSTCWNASQYIHKTIETLKQQTVKDWKCYITDDCSTDGSQTYVEELIKGDNRFELICNEKKFYQPGNYYLTLHRSDISDQDIAMTVDGDDWLPDEKVFERVLDAYRDPHLWITCGQFWDYFSPDKGYKGCAGTPDFNNLRGFQTWVATHLRTFKVFLFRHILMEDLTAPNGNFWECAGDLSFMLPMLEMAGPNHFKFLPDINYVYNEETPLQDRKVNTLRQQQYTRALRAKQPYSRISG